MKTTGLLIGILLLTGVAWAGEHDDSGDTDRPGDTIRQEYNPMENRWETIQGQKDLTYNPMEKEWSYQDRGANPTYNPMEGTWEYPK